MTLLDSAFRVSPRARIAEVPEELLEDPGRFNQVVELMTRLAGSRKPGSAVPKLSGLYQRYAVSPTAQKTLDAAASREANEDAKRRRLAEGMLGLDMYSMREPLQEAGLRYVD